jgi:hypothetical protein
MEVAIRDLGKLAPLAVVLAIAGVVMAWMLQHQLTIGPWVLAAFLFGHGLVHIMFAYTPTAAPGTASDYPFDPNRSWTVTSGLITVETLRIVVAALVAFVIVGYSLTALATVGLLVSASWWSTLLVVSTVGSLALMVIGLSPALALGIAIDLVLFWLAITAAWSPSGAAA